MNISDLEDEFNLTFRRSVESDETQLRRLVESRFGERSEFGGL